MADGSKIEWTDATWNPITGCSIVSPGCTNCYAMRLAGTRLRNHPSRKGLTLASKAGPVWTGEVRFNEHWLHDPVKWKEPRNIFICAHGDLFHEKVPDAWIARVLSVAIEAHWHHYQILTKRGARMWKIMSAHSPKARHNIILGVSVEDQRRANKRRAHLNLLADHGWPTFCSYEPALGLVDWRGWEFLRWMISGGENGPRPSHPDWHRAARDFCATHGIPYLFKQQGSWSVIVDRDRDDPGWRADYGVVGRKPDYRILNLAGGLGFHGERVLLMRRVGKKAGGRFLDGIEHNGFPT
jgi:protein gp37